MSSPVTQKGEGAKVKCGLEIHAQLDTKKLFCNCPTIARDDTPDAVFKRRLRAVVGETDQVDIAARQEMEKEKFFLYQFYSDCSCLVDLDEEPPHEINEDALGIVLQVAKAMQCKIADEIHVMRKTVVDGSNTSGFQRTALVGFDGTLSIGTKKVSITTACIEEEAAKIVERTEAHDVYNLSRLGIPLIEISTGPDISSPEEAMAVAEKIGMILRSTGRMKRGIGTIRQDINISIPGGTRIEIKGAQELRLIPEYVRNEMRRQQGLLDIKAKVEGIRLEKHIVDLTPLFASSESKVIKKSLQAKGAVLGTRLQGFAGIPGTELQPNKRFGTELSDQAKVRAGVTGLFHSDELPNYGITQTEVDAVRKELGCRKEDAFVLIADAKERAFKGLEAAFDRAVFAGQGVPKEVRKPNEDGTTTYQRPIPGADRMYPETDVRVMRPNLDIKGIEMIEDTAKRFEGLGLGKDLALLIAKEKAQLFEQLLRFKNVKPAFVAETILPKMLDIKRKGLDIEKVQDADFIRIFSLLDQGAITKQAIEDILIERITTGTVDYAHHHVLDDKKLETELKAFLANHPSADSKALQGMAINEFKKRADAALIMQVFNKIRK